MASGVPCGDVSTSPASCEPLGKWHSLSVLCPPLSREWAVVPASSCWIGACLAPTGILWRADTSTDVPGRGEPGTQGAGPPTPPPQPQRPTLPTVWTELPGEATPKPRTHYLCHWNLWTLWTEGWSEAPWWGEGPGTAPPQLWHRFSAAPSYSLNTLAAEWGRLHTSSWLWTGKKQAEVMLPGRTWLGNKHKYQRIFKFGYNKLTLNSDSCSNTCFKLY